MNFTFELSRDAERYLRRLDRPAQQRIAGAIRALADDPFHRGTKPLSGFPGRRATRVGGWRIVYSPDTERRHIAVSDIAPRGEVYRNL